MYHDFYSFKKKIKEEGKTECLDELPNKLFLINKGS